METRRPPVRCTRTITRASIAIIAGALALADPAAQQPPKPIAKVLYVLPNFLGFLYVSEPTLATEVARLRQRLVEGTYVRVGFTTYVVLDLSDWRVNPADPAAVARALSKTIAAIDEAIARARANNIPLCVSLLTPARETYNPVERDAESEDRRNTMWYMDNGLSNGWVTHSRYARKFQRVLEAYVRGLGRVLADRMRRFPSTLVAASGDGEVELSFDRSPIVNPAYTEANAQLADYSPFAVAEFRDWLRNAGLYAPGQALAGQGYERAARYESDAAPGIDTSGDGHTLNSDFGTSFSTWDLRFFPWSLSDQADPDPHAIPAFVYNAPGWNANPDEGAARFDPPRVRQQGQVWWQVWDLFRQTMIWRHNRDFARWITTSPDETGATVPASRWYSDQVPADYVFNSSPEMPNYRLVTSASPLWAADISPYGSLGITAFNINLGGSTYAYTARNVAPVIARRGVKWGVFEWNPSVPISQALAVYEEEMTVMEQYQPSVLVPVYWDPGAVADTEVQNTGFEVALRRYIERVRSGPRPVGVPTPAVAPRFAKPGDPMPLRPLGLGQLRLQDRTIR